MQNTIIELDILQSAGLGAVALVLGLWLTRRIGVLRRFCIPSPVSGGLVVALLGLLLYSLAGIQLRMDNTLKDVFMIAFFCSVGFQCNLRTVREGGKTLLVLLGLLVVIIIMQNTLSLIICSMLGTDTLVGMAAGSISMTGGHGTAGGFAPLLEQMGLSEASTISMAAATFGLLAGSLTGGPLAARLIRRHLGREKADTKEHLNRSVTVMAGIESHEASPAGHQEHLSTREEEFRQYARSTYWIISVMAAGTLLSHALQLTGVMFPTYFGALILAAVTRNLLDWANRRGHLKRIALDMDRISSVGNISMSLFLGMVMVSLRLWELKLLALPLVTILAAQVIFLCAFSYWIAFRVLGRDYDSAVLVAGICGFGLGATPNAIANMSATCYKYHYTIKPFLLIPIVGAMFTDILNSGIISLFLRLLGA